MNGDDFDDTLTNLYQQRKQQVTPPKIILGAKKQTFLSKLLSGIALVLSGGVVSFGILALVQQLVPMPAPVTTASSHSIGVVETIPKQEIGEIKVQANVLPEKPTHPVKEYSTTSSIPVELVTNVDIMPIESNVSKIEVSILPSINIGLNHIKPIYRAIPKVTPTMQLPIDGGSITLSYQIDKTGHPYNIKIIEANVNSEIKRATKYALSQWRFPNNLDVKTTHTVEFSFQK